MQTELFCSFMILLLLDMGRGKEWCQRLKPPALSHCKSCSTQVLASPGTTPLQVSPPYPWVQTRRFDPTQVRRASLYLWMWPEEFSSCIGREAFTGAHDLPTLQKSCWNLLRRTSRLVKTGIVSQKAPAGLLRCGEATHSLSVPQNTSRHDWKALLFASRGLLIAPTQLSTDFSILKRPGNGSPQIPKDILYLEVSSS